MIFRSWGRDVENKLALNVLREQVDEMRRQMVVLTETIRVAASQPPPATESVNSEIVLRMLQSIEELSGKFYQVWEREKQQAREQRKGARAKGVEKQEAAKAKYQEEAEKLPNQVLACGACMDLIDGGKLAGALDTLRHAREEHDMLYATWLKPGPRAN